MLRIEVRRELGVNPPTTVTQSGLSAFLLNVALVRPVFIWGQPGIGKSALVEQFAAELGLECVSMLGSQLAPEDLIGVPQIIDGKSRFCPPRTIARDEPYCLFLDELNACTNEVQKAFYSLIHDRRVGEYELPEGSIVIGAGNRAQDTAIVRPLSSALLNRMVHVHLEVSVRDWTAWAERSGIHPVVLQYIRNRPDHLRASPPKHEEPFSTPRSWHMLSDVLHQWAGDGGPDGTDIGGMPDHGLEAVAFGCLSPSHAAQFKAFVKQMRSRFGIEQILKGDQRWPSAATDRDVLYFLAQSFRARLVRDLPEQKAGLRGKTQEFVHRAKALLKDLARINLEIAQMVVADPDDGAGLPAWFMVEIVRDLPRLVARGR
jgi:hypothetical protein